MGRFDALTRLEEKETPKKLNTAAITDGPPVFPPKKPAPTATPVMGVPIPVPPPVPRTGRGTVPLVPKVKRVIRQRQPFDIYEDQYKRLKKIAESEREFVNGRGMSQMVREAIDNYLRDYCSSKE